MDELVFAGARLAPGRDRRGAPAVDGLDLRLRAGECVALLGANGAGKSTILRAALGALPPQAGSVTVDGVSTHRLSRPMAARLFSWLPQERPLAFPIRVGELVKLGRFAHPPGAETDQAVAEALARTGLDGFRARRLDSLSGGERARAHLARALATRAPVLLVDEPNAALDPGFAWELGAILQAEAARGTLVLAALHDWRLAARFASRLVFLKAGRLIADRPGGGIGAIGADLLADIYGPGGEWAEWEIDVGRDQLPSSGPDRT